MAISESTRARRFALPDHGSDVRADEAIEAFIEGPPVRRQRPKARRRPRKAYPNTGSAGAPTAPPEASAPTTVSATEPAASPAAEPATDHTPEPVTDSTADPATGPAAEPAAEPSAVVPAPEPDARRLTNGARPLTDIRTIPGRLEFGAALERESLRAARYGRPASVAIVELVPERHNQAVDIWVRSIAGPVARTLRQSARATDLVARVSNARFHVLLPETHGAGAGRFAERVESACQTSIEAAGAPLAIRVTLAIATPDHSLQEALTHALQAIEAA